MAETYFFEFREAIHPTVTAMSALASAAAAVPERHEFQPAAGSYAWEERARKEAPYRLRGRWDEPIVETHSFGGITMFAAIDHAKAFGAALVAPETPVYAHLVIARSVMETSVIRWWLNEPGIQADERVRRGLAEHIYNAWEMKRLRIEEDDADARIEKWKAVADSLGWKITNVRGKPKVGDTSWPSIPEGIDQLIGTVGRRLGRVQWSYLSAVAHGTFYGLRDAMESPPDGDSLTPLVSFGTSLTSVQNQAICVSRALRNAAHNRFVLFGWDDDEWREACRIAETHENALLETRLGRA